MAETTSENVGTKSEEVCGVMLLDKPPKDTEPELRAPEENANWLVVVSSVAMRLWPT